MLLAGWRVTLGQGAHLLSPAWPYVSLLEDLGDGDPGCLCHHQLLGAGCVQAGLSCSHTTHSWERDAQGLMIPCQHQRPLTGTGNVPWQPPTVAPLFCILGQRWFGLA